MLDIIEMEFDKEPMSRINYKYTIKEMRTDKVLCEDYKLLSLADTTFDDDLVVEKYVDDNKQEVIYYIEEGLH